MNGPKKPSAAQRAVLLAYIEERDPFAGCEGRGRYERFRAIDVCVREGWISLDVTDAGREVVKR